MANVRKSSRSINKLPYIVVCPHLIVIFPVKDVHIQSASKIIGVPSGERVVLRGWGLVSSGYMKLGGGGQKLE